MGQSALYLLDPILGRDQDGTSSSDGLASPQHPSVLLQGKAKAWKGAVEVEWPYGARADFAGTLHAEHKKAADILL